MPGALPHIHAEDVWLGNPKNMPGDSMVTLQRVDASIAPLALLRKELLIPRIWLKQPNASLERLANGDNNWTFDLAAGEIRSNRLPPGRLPFTTSCSTRDRSPLKMPP